jgi:hypothetical protein
MIQIEKGIPLPTVRSVNTRKKYDFGSMEVGDSFAVEVTRKRKAANIKNTLSSSSCDYAKRHKKPWKFTVRRVVENGVKKVRIWRIA